MRTQALKWACPLCGAENYGDTGPQPCWRCDDNPAKAARVVAAEIEDPPMDGGRTDGTMVIPPSEGDDTGEVVHIR